jgi:hypothetical protein
MRALTPREKRTIRIGLVALAVYLGGLYGLRGWRYLEARRDEYAQLCLAGEKLKGEILREKVKALRLQRLRESSRLDLAKLDVKTASGEALAAVQKAAQGLGIALTTLKETPGRSSARELAAFQAEGVGPTLAVAQFLDNLKTLGFPLVIDSLQLKTAGMQPGQVQLSLGVVLLDFTAWKKAEKGNA